MVKKALKNLAIPLILLATLPLFFYNLGSYSLVDFDEAWYAEIARNIIKLHQPLLLSFNGSPYLDHPPLGFGLMALFLFLFGTTDFAARIPSAILGFGAVILTYLIGKTLVNRFVGLSSALMLVSSVWFIFRAREADLDVPFIFFYLFTLLAGLKVRSSPKWLYLLALMFAATLQTKALLGVSLLPAIVILVFQARSKITRKSAALSLITFILALSPWLVASFLSYGIGFVHRLFSIGTRPDYRVLFSPSTLTYLHSGIGKWYYPALVSLPLAVFLVRKKPQLLAILVTAAILFGGFITNSKTEIWHLLPIYPLVFLILSAVLFLPVIYFAKHFQVAGILLIISVAGYQIYGFRHSIRLTDFGRSDLANVSLAAKGRMEPLYLDGQDFFPSTVFYSQKQVTSDRNVFPPPDNNLIGIVSRGKRPFLLITEDWRLKSDKIDLSQLQVLSQSGSWVLLLLN